MGNMPAGQNHSSFALNTRLSAPRYDTWCKIQVLKRITFEKDVLCGKPLIRGLRISIEMLLELLAKGATEQEILEDYLEVEADDIRAALI
jgi:uncharacterized protein (DUF433 family)